MVIKVLAKESKQVKFVQLMEIALKAGSKHYKEL